MALVTDAPATTAQPPKPGRRAASRRRVSSSTLKVVMAISGTILLLFVFVHMIGNLKVYLGPAHLNDYAAFLRDVGEPIVPHEFVLWVLRIALLICVFAHIGAAAVLTKRSRQHGAGRAARSTRVGTWRSFTSRTMPISGIIIAAFVIFHILDLTLGTAAGKGFEHPETIDGTTHYFAYQNLVGSFERPLVAAFYVIAMLVLGAHLLHGSWSVIHDLGVTGRRTRQTLFASGVLMVTAVMIGNISIPIAVQLGWVS